MSLDEWVLLGFGVIAAVSLVFVMLLGCCEVVHSRELANSADSDSHSDKRRKRQRPEVSDLLSVAASQPTDHHALVCALSLTPEQRQRWDELLTAEINRMDMLSSAPHQLTLESFRQAIVWHPMRPVPVYDHQVAGLLEFADRCDLPTLAHVILSRMETRKPISNRKNNHLNQTTSK